MLLGQRLHVGGRFREGVAIGGIVIDALAEIVEQDAQFAEILGAGDQKVDARPIEIGVRGRRAGGDPNAGDVDGGEKFQQACSKAGDMRLVLESSSRRVSSLKISGVTGDFSARTMAYRSRPMVRAVLEVQPLEFLNTKMRTGWGVSRSVSPTMVPSAWRNSSKRTMVSWPTFSPASVRTSKGPEL
jgi:hypothetical protein